MRLEIGREPGITDPSDSQIAEGLAPLTGEESSFAVLHDTGMTYVQTSGCSTT